MIETVFNKEMFRDKQEMERNQIKPAYVLNVDNEQRKRSNSLTVKKSEDITDEEPKVVKQGPMTFSEIQETIIRKAMEDSAVLSTGIKNESSHENQKQESIPIDNGGVSDSSNKKQPMSIQPVNVKPKMPLNISHMGMDLAIRNPNLYKHMTVGNAGGSKTFFPIVLPKEEKSALIKTPIVPQVS